jgi:hypothetical protein
MASDVQICNMALYLLGAEAITAISPPDDNDRARVCALWYAPSRDAVLRAHDWNFAIRRATLNLDTPSTPTSGYDYQFVLPTDPYCLRVIEVNDDPEADWVVEGRRLLSDDSTVILKYLAQITDPGNFDSLFVEALAVKMAVNLAMPITKDAKVMANMNQLYEMKLAEARGVNDHEMGNVPEPTSPFISVR